MLWQATWVNLHDAAAVNVQSITLPTIKTINEPQSGKENKIRHLRFDNNDKIPEQTDRFARIMFEAIVCGIDTDFFTMKKLASKSKPG